MTTMANLWPKLFRTVVSSVKFDQPKAKRLSWQHEYLLPSSTLSMSTTRTNIKDKRIERELFNPKAQGCSRYHTQFGQWPATKRLTSSCSNLSALMKHWWPVVGTTSNSQIISTVHYSPYSTQTGSGTGREFTTESPYKPDKPTRYGYEQHLFDGGPLPRLEQSIRSLPLYKPKDAWSEKKALFGQNDYIDILGDGSIQPYELINGPVWIRGFKGHEYARTLRRIKFTGSKLQQTHPKIYKDLRKSLKYLYREHNMVRKSHRTKPKHM